MSDNENSLKIPSRFVEVKIPLLRSNISLKCVVLFSNIILLHLPISFIGVSNVIVIICVSLSFSYFRNALFSSLASRLSCLAFLLDSLPWLLLESLAR